MNKYGPLILLALGLLVVWLRSNGYFETTQKTELEDIDCEELTKAMGGKNHDGRVYLHVDYDEEGNAIRKTYCLP